MTEVTYEQLLAVFNAAATNGETGENTAVSPFIDWHEAWARYHNRPETDWLAAPILPRGRSAALFAKGGTGKSLFVLWLVGALATGREIFGAKRPPIDVLYLDYEMTEDDLIGRLEAMGYEPDDLGHLHYDLLPELAPLDGQAGSEAVAALAELAGADLVVIDTFGRAVAGNENDADTVRAWYRWTGQRLKRDGRAFIRIDHAGKDVERGQRGTSAKNDDVDVVWQMTELDRKRYRLTAIKRRLDSIPELVEVDQVTDDVGLTYRLVVGDIGYPQGTARVTVDLDRLGVALDASRRKADEILRAAGCGARTQIVSAALRYRREQVVRVVPEGPGPPSRDPEPGSIGNPFAESDKHAGQGIDSGSRIHGEPLSEYDGVRWVVTVKEPPNPGTTPGLFDDVDDIDGPGA
jgi:hypothetical protein